jgi:hypothetical protein
MQENTVLRISNWDVWQTFRKDRGTPPWIKVYRNLLSNPEWVILTDSEKGHLVSIWLLAADKKGTIPSDPKIIQKMCMIESLPNINKFIELGFLEGNSLSGGNQVVTIPPQLDAPETEKSRVEETRVETTNGQKTTFDRFWRTYPRKQKKKRATEIWYSKKLHNHIEMIITDIQNRIANHAPWKQGYIPHPTTYLNGELWNDEIEKEDSVKKNNSNGKSIIQEVADAFTKHNK